MLTPSDSPQLTAYLTWSLGIDMPGLAIVYATDKPSARALLDNYCILAQPKHRVFDVYMPLEIRQGQEDNAPGVHLFSVGLAPAGTRAHVLVIERGEDVRFDD